MTPPTGDTHTRRQSSRFLCAAKTPLFIFQSLVTALNFALWLYLWRTPIWSDDDLHWATLSGNAGGRNSLGDYARDLSTFVIDLNGRSADVIAGFVARSDLNQTLIFATLFTLLPLSLWFAYRGLNPHSGPTWVNAVIFSTFTLSVFGLAKIDAAIFDNQIAFMSAAVNHTFALTCFSFIVGIGCRVFSRNPIPISAMVGLSLFTIFTAFLQEIVALLIVCFGIFLTLEGFFKHRERRAYIFGAAIIVSGLVRFLAPGLWVRTNATDTIIPLLGRSGLVDHYVLLCHSLTHTVVQYRILLGIFVVTLACYLWSTIALTPTTAGRTPRPLVKYCLLGTGLVLTAVAFLGIRRVYMSFGRNHSSAEAIASVYSSTTMILSLVALGAAVAVFAYFALIMAKDGQGLLVFVFGILIGSYITLGYLGFSYGRQMFPFQLSLLFSTMLLAGSTLTTWFESQPLRHLDRSTLVRTAALSLACAAGAAYLCLNAVPGIIKYNRGVNQNTPIWNQVISQFAPQHLNSAATIYIPKSLPSRIATTYNYIGKYPESAESSLRIYYQIPEEVTIRFVDLNEFTAQMRQR